ncbi:MAG: DUF4367 domain-containing protein [Burkholderiales bacterium]|nr:DUF4367 domain-containing protein [Anaerolineae bacterium]
MIRPTMNEAEWEARVQQVAREFAYPPTPDIVRAVGQRVKPIPTPRHPRLAWAVLVALVIFSAALIVPDVRAAVLEVLRIGAISIFGTEPSSTPTLTARASTSEPRPTEPLPPIMTSALDLPGETTLDDARAQLNFPLLPTYPADLGQPERVFVQDLGGEIVTLVWLETGSDSETRLVLQILDRGVSGIKLHSVATSITTDVNGERAIWLTEPHMLEFFEDGNDAEEFRRRVEQNVLVWEVRGVTYRLESDLSLAEAIRVAESLTPP